MFGYEMIEEFLMFNNKKMKKYETLDEYLGNFKRYELTRLAITHLIGNDNIYDLFKVRNLANKPKKEIIKYIKENLNSILEVYVRIVRTNELEFLKKVVSNNGILNVSIEEIDLLFIELVKNIPLSHVYYDKKLFCVHIYMPKEFVNIFKKLIKDKEIIKINKRNNKIYDVVDTIINFYGVIDIFKLSEILNKNKYKVNEHDLLDILSAHALITDMFKIYADSNLALICSSEIDEDLAFMIFDNNEYDYNDNYSLENMEKIKTGKFLHSLKSYKKLINYLDETFENISGDIESIDTLIIQDYMITAQLDEDLAIKNFEYKVNRMFDYTSVRELNIMKNMLKDIFNEYPKWMKKGNV